MASKLSAALSGIPAAGMERLRGAGAMTVGVAQAGVDPSYESKSNLLGTVGKMAQIGADAYMQHDAMAQKRADERSNEIISKLTPEQRRQAMQNGTLLYQDDPYAMKALKEKTGRNAAFLLDDEVAQKVQRGEFKTRQEMEEYRHKRLQDGSVEFANQFGLDHSDKDFQRGFSSDITQRNIQLYGAHDSFLSDQAKKGAMLNTKMELDGALKDPNVLRSPQGADFFDGYIKKGLESGIIPSDDEATQMVAANLGGIVQRPGGAQMLINLENKTIKLHGADTTYKALLGDEQWNNMVVKAQHAEFQNDAKRTEKFNLDMNSALNQSDLNQGWAMLQAQKAELDKIQPGEQLTPERQQLIQAQMQMQDRLRQESAATAKATDDARKGQNKDMVLEASYLKRINGDYVSTDFKDQPTNENTGEFKHSDAVNFANRKLAQIDQMNVPDEQKDKLKLQYLRADSAEGPFRTQIGTMISDADGEWRAAVINGEMPDETPAMTKLRALRNADPNLIAALYPDQAGLFAKMDMMDKLGVKPQIMIDAERNKQGMTKDQLIEADKSWTATLNSSTAEEIARMPSSLRNSARQVFDAFNYATGNVDGAMEQVTKFLKESTTTFQSDDLDGGSFGVIPKVNLQVNDDPDSWKQGKDIIDTAVKGIISTNPWVTNKQLSVYQQGNDIRIMDTTGSINIRYDKQLLSQVWKDQQEKAQAKAQADALKDINKRAPIAAVNKAREDIKSGKRKGLAQRAQEFRESRGIK